jgi:hypothetical protein
MKTEKFAEELEKELEERYNLCSNTANNYICKHFCTINGVTNRYTSQQSVGE